jgi:CheY-like chemotaxis protein
MKKHRNKSAAGEPNAIRPTLVAGAPKPAATVLHIDDDPNDAELFHAAARRANVSFQVQNVGEGEQAMAYLNGRGLYGNRELYPMPVLVLLDLKMPRATGFDVLQWIRAHPVAGSLPVVVLSGSELQDDMQRAYAGGADSYVVKPIGFAALVELVKRLDSDWIRGSEPRVASVLTKRVRGGWPRATDWQDPIDGSGARP